MGDEQAAVLSLAIRNNLCDNRAEHRKQAAKDIEDQVRRLLRDSRERPGSSSGYASFVNATVHSGAVVPSVASTSTGGIGVPTSADAVSASGAPGAITAADEQVSRLVRCIVDDYCRSAFPVHRKGGLIGLASMSIALEHQHVQRHVLQILPPVLDLFNDEDSGVRYNACESFYNIAKVAREGVLPFFGTIFDGLCRLYVDVDQAVKDGVQCVDRLVRDIVTESRNFCYADVIPMLTTRIKVLNPAVRQLVLGWLILLDSLPQVEMMPYLPQYLEGLFGILASDNRDLRHSAEVCLSELLSEIRSSVSERPARARRAAADAARTVARCCRAGERRPEDNYVRLRALIWLVELVRLQTDLEFGPSEASPHADMKPTDVTLNEHRSMQNPSSSSAGPVSPPRWVTSGLHLSPFRGVPPSSVSPRDEEGLQHLLPVLLAGALHCLDDSESEIRLNAGHANSALRVAAQCLGVDVPVEALMDVVLSAMREGSGGQERSALALQNCLSWAQLLLSQSPSRVLRPEVRDQVIEAALDVFTQPEDEVAIAALGLLARIAAASDASNVGNTAQACAGEAVAAGSSGSNTTAVTLAAPGSENVSSASMVVKANSQHTQNQGNEPGRFLLADVCKRLFQLIVGGSSNVSGQAALRGRGELAVRRLCEGVGAERLYATAARTLAQENDLSFSQRLIRVLHRALLTARETRELRAQLRREADNLVRGGGARGSSSEGGHADNGSSLPFELLLVWFKCPVCALGLALWLHWFELAAGIAARLARQDITDEQRSHLDELAELLESPVFVSVRLELLDARCRPAPLRAILGLLALRPNERALDARLEIVTIGLLLDKLGDGPRHPRSSPPVVNTHSGTKNVRRCDNADAQLLARFDAVADAHGWRQVTM